ncbi:MAG TPA: hypothetical protein VF533_02050 [Solirubrobacteraceae bacterium]
MRTWLRAFGLALLVVLAGPAGHASADVTQVQTVIATSATSSAAKSVTATCPAGKKVIGAGANVDNGLNPFVPSVFVDQIRPSASLDSVTVRVREGETGSDFSWWVAAYAVCAAPPAGLQRVAAMSAADSSAKSVVAVCPTGKRLLGTGGEVTGPAGQVVLAGVKPDVYLTRTQVDALEDETGTAQGWTVTAYAICAAPVRGMERVAATSATDSTGAKYADASCPEGKALTGGGGTMNSSNGRVRLDSVITMEGATHFAEAGAQEGPAGNSADWSVSAYAICAATTRLVSSTSPRYDELDRQWPVSCPAGMTASGAGGQVTGPAGSVWLRGLRPSTTGVVAFGAEGALRRPWSLTAHAVCRTAVSGTVVVTAAGTFDTTSPKSATVACPDGLRVVGAGGEGTDTSSYERQVLLQAVRPNAGLTSVTVSAKVWSTWDPETVAPWRPVAWAICAPAPAGLERVAYTSPAAPDELATAAAVCPAGKHLVGSGGEIAGGDGLTGLDDLAPDPALTRTSVVAARQPDWPYPAPDWSLTAYAICISR